MKILVCDPVDETIIDHFRNQENVSILETFEEQEFHNELDDAHFLVVRSGTTVDRDVLDRAQQLVGIVRAGVGLDNIDLKEAEKRGVNVENTPEASTNAVAELVVGHILSLYRSIPRADRSLKRGEWIKGTLNGREIQNKTAGIIGFGRIGRRIAQILSGFGADVQAFDQYITANKIRSDGVEPVSFKSLIRTSDIVTLHVPFNSETKNLIDSEELRNFKEGAVLINTARGGIVNEDALNQAIGAGELYGAGVDTFLTEPPGGTDLISNNDVVSTPHIGASTAEAQARIAKLVIQKIEEMKSSTVV